MNHECHESPFWIRTRQWSPILNHRLVTRPLFWTSDTKLDQSPYTGLKSIHHDAWDVTTHTYAINIIGSPLNHKHHQWGHHLNITSMICNYNSPLPIIQAFNNIWLYIHKVFAHLLEHINLIHQLVKHNKTSTNSHWNRKNLEKSSEEHKTGQPRSWRSTHPSRRSSWHVCHPCPYALVIQETTVRDACSIDHDGWPVTCLTIVIFPQSGDGWFYMVVTPVTTMQKAKLHFLPLEIFQAPILTSSHPSHINQHV